ncbi:MAG: acyltransferase [Burkholderiales bacterium]
MHRYLLIDALRGMAALLVLVYHVIEVGQWSAFPVEGPLKVFRIGWIGVDLFFVISGFVIGLSAMQSAATDPLNWRRPFAERRLRRIVPLYLLTCLACLFLVDPTALLRGFSNAAVEITTHLLFIHNLFPRTYYSINGPAWSIALEMQFYLLVLLTGRWLAGASAWRIVLIWAGTAIAWRYGTTIALPPGPSLPLKQMMKAMQLPGVLDAFGVGIGLAKLAMTGRLAPGWGRFALYSAVAALLLGIAWYIFWNNPEYWSSTGMIVGWRGLLALGFAALLAAVVVCPTDGGWLSWPLRYLGVVSYGIYLWHFAIVLTLVQATPWRGSELLIATLLGTVVLASLSWWGFEKIWLKMPPKILPSQVARAV